MIHINSNPRDEAHKCHEDNLRTSVPKACSMVNSVNSVKRNNLFDLPKKMERDATIGSFNITLEDYEWYIAVLASEEAKRFSELANAVKLNPSNVGMLNHRVE